MYYYPDELYHHGIKGQRWGVRNGPPYPLNPQTHASVVRSGGNRGRTRPVSRGRVRGLTEEDTKYDPKFRTKAERDEYERRSARAQKIKKGLLIGAGGAALAGAAAYGLARRGGYGNYVKNFGRGGIKEMAQYAKVGARRIPKDIGGAVSSLRNRIGDSRTAQKVGRSLGNIRTNMTTGYNEAKRKIFNSKVYGNIERKLNDPRIRLAKRKAGYMAKDIGNKVSFNLGKAEGTFVRNANKVRNSINTGRYAANRGSRYLKSLAADKYGYQAVNTITRGTKLAAKGAALGAAGTYIYKKRKKRKG